MIRQCVPAQWGQRAEAARGREQKEQQREIVDGDKGADDEEQPSYAQPMHRTHPTGKLEPLDLELLANAFGRFGKKSADVESLSNVL